MQKPYPTFRDLKQRVSIEHVLAQRGLLGRLRRQGDRLIGACPVHQGDSPAAFVVSLSKNLWHCFTGCAGGGDVVELVRRLDRCSYGHVARYLHTLVRARPVTRRVVTEPTRSFAAFTRSLPLDHASPWLARKRIRPETARVFEAGQYHGGGFLRGCLAVRLHDLDGLPLGYTGRRLDPDESTASGKWKLPPGFPRTRILYGFHHVRARAAMLGLVVVECPWGVMRLAQLGVPAVALLGTHASDEQRRLLSLAPSLVLLMDGDPAGRRGAARIAAQLHDAEVHVATLPEGLDPDDLTDRDLAAVLNPFFRPRNIDYRDHATVR